MREIDESEVQAHLQKLVCDGILEVITVEGEDYYRETKEAWLKRMKEKKGSI